MKIIKNTEGYAILSVVGESAMCADERGVWVTEINPSAHFIEKGTTCFYLDIPFVLYYSVRHGDIFICTDRKIG